MNNIVDLNSIDTDWAWARYEPKSDSDWSLAHAAHLYRRAGFAVDRETLEQAITSKSVELVHKLVHTEKETASFESESQSLADLVLATAKVENLPAWWTYRLLHTGRPLHEKMTLFWHGHFATSGEKVTESKLMHEQNQLLRKHALGDFGVLLHEISRDPAMLIYLDSVTNRKTHPNENYAREIMELFCLGEGNYTENDIRELARCFTGWEIRRDKFRFNRYQHDTGKKTILGETGEFSGDDGVDIVLRQKAGPEFIVRKLMKFFLFDEPEPADTLVKPLAEKLRNDNWQIGPTIETMLASNLFFSKHCMGRKIKSPVEFAVGFLNALEGTTNLYALSNGLTDLGQVLFFPPNVKGWDGGRAWINSSTLLARANLIRSLLDRKETRFTAGKLSDFFDKHNLRKPEQIVDWLEQTMFAISLSDELKNQLAREFDAGKANREQRLRNGLHLMCTLPEFQMA